MINPPTRPQSLTRTDLVAGKDYDMTFAYRGRNGGENYSGRVRVVSVDPVKKVNGVYGSKIVPAKSSKGVTVVRVAADGTIDETKTVYASLDNLYPLGEWVAYAEKYSAYAKESHAQHKNYTDNVLVPSAERLAALLREAATVDGRKPYISDYTTLNFFGKDVAKMDALSAVIEAGLKALEDQAEAERNSMSILAGMRG